MMSEALTQYALAYLGIGGTFLILVLALHAYSLLSNFRLRRRAWSRHQFSRITFREQAMGLMVNISVGIIVIAAWPILMVIFLWGLKPRPSNLSLFDEPKPLEVGVKDLGAPISLSEVERRERVYDPMGAVPDLPFGHLHPAWERFKMKLGPGDTLWTFDTIWCDRMGQNEMKKGYVIVGKDGPSSFILSNKKPSPPSASAISPGMAPNIRKGFAL